MRGHDLLVICLDEHTIFAFRPEEAPVLIIAADNHPNEHFVFFLVSTQTVH